MNDEELDELEVEILKESDKLIEKLNNDLMKISIETSPKVEILMDSIEKLITDEKKIKIIKSILKKTISKDDDFGSILFSIDPLDILKIIKHSYYQGINCAADNKIKKSLRNKKQ